MWLTLPTRWQKHLIIPRLFQYLIFSQSKPNDFIADQLSAMLFYTDLNVIATHFPVNLSEIHYIGHSRVAERQCLESLWKQRLWQEFIKFAQHITSHHRHLAVGNAVREECSDLIWQSASGRHFVLPVDLRIQSDNIVIMGIQIFKIHGGEFVIRKRTLFLSH